MSISAQIPHSKDSEEALIGAALIDPACLHSLTIAPDDFYIQRHKWIWAAMVELSRRGVAPDIVTLTDKLSELGHLGEIGGPAYLSGLIAQSITSMYADNYAAIVQDKARRRRLIEAASALAKAAYSSDAVDGAVMSVIQSIATDTAGGSMARPFSEFVSRLYDDVGERVKSPKDVYGLPTGLPEFDRVTGGLQPGEIIYIGGAPGIGKSILSVQMGIGMAQAGYPGAVYSLEMRGLQVSRRIVSSLGRMETSKLKSGKFERDDWHTFTQACEAASALPVYLSDASELSTASLRSDLARLKVQHGIRWFVLDYLYLMSDEEKGLKPFERTEILSSRVKLINKEFDLVGITVNSVTKEGDLRGSNQVKHDADMVLMLVEHQADVTTNYEQRTNMRTLMFVKGRELVVPKGYIQLVKQDNYPSFGCVVPEPNTQRIPEKDRSNGQRRKQAV